MKVKCIEIYNQDTGSWELISDVLLRVDAGRGKKRGEKLAEMGERLFYGR